MKLLTLLLLVAIIGKMSALPVQYRLGYYRAADPQAVEAVSGEADDQEEDVADDDDEESNEEDFTQDVQDDDDDDDEEQESPPEFSKLFPLASPNQPGYNLPLTSMMSEISTQSWNVPKTPPNQKQQQRARYALDLARDDDDSEEDSDEDEEEDDDVEDDLPDYQKLFPNLEESGHGPPSGVVDTSSQPELPQFRSGLAGSRVVYMPASQVYGGASGRQYVARQPSPPRAQVQYAVVPSYGQYGQRRTQPMMVPARRSQQYYYYMPVRRNYSPYVANWRHQRQLPRYRY